ncbi:MAG: hypothetical protein ABI301_03480 [Jatrophihabitantaceae bacterium]
MALFHRRDVPPAAALAKLQGDDRVLAWGDTKDGNVVLATQWGLWWPDGAQFRLIGWQHVTKAVWRDGSLIVTEADVVEDMMMIDRPPVIAALSVPRDLPPTVRTRVEGNIVRSEIATVAGGAARFVARRVPGEDGLRWWARLDSGTPDTDQVRSAIGARLAILRAEYEQEQADQLR